MESDPPSKNICDNNLRTQTVENNGNLQFIFTTEGLPLVIGKKVAGIVEELNSDVINLQSLKAYLAVGVPDQATIIRQYCWKLIFGYLPLQKNKWTSTIQKQSNTYEGLVRMFLPLQKFEDYPLILKKGHPRFKELEEDFLLWQQIEKDTSRTHAEFSFFAAQSKEMMIPYLTSARRQKFKMIYGEDEEAYQQFLTQKQRQKKTYRYDYMTRILYIYSKLNPKVQYVQGMNEILAPIFYLVNVSKPADQIQEAACFFMFNNAICDILELHIKDLDKSRNGIYGKLNEVNQMLLVIDPQVWNRMEMLKIDPFFYCFRWVTLLYAQDFALFDTMRIWESIFSAQERCLYINLLAIAIILSFKDIIMQSQFTAILSELHSISDLNIHQIIQIADNLYQLHLKTDFTLEAKKARKIIAKQKKKEKHAQNTGEESEKTNEQKVKVKKQKKKDKNEQKEKRQIKDINQDSKVEVKSSKQQKPQQIVQNSKKQEYQMGQIKVQQQKKAKKGGIFKKFTNFVDKFMNNS